MVPYRIVLANNHAPFRQCLRRILKGKCELEIIGEAEDDLELFNLLSSSEGTPNMVIVDPSMPNFRGAEAIRKIKAAYPDMKVLILSMHRDKEYLSQAISNGAEGYLLKEDVGEQLLFAIEMIRGGKVYVPPFP